MPERVSNVVIGGAPEWSAAGPGRVRRAPWVVWGYVDTVERAFSASLAHLGSVHGLFTAKFTTVHVFGVNIRLQLTCSPNPATFAPQICFYYLLPTSRDASSALAAPRTPTIFSTRKNAENPM